MEFESEPYYVGLLSAAALHGAAHQQPQEFQVIDSRQTRPAVVGRSRIRFLLKKHIKRTETISLKTETGAMKISTPESTALDLVRYPRHAGGLNNIATVLADLAEKIDPEHLSEAARRDDDLPSAQRLGFLLEHIGEEAKVKPLAEWIKSSLDRKSTRLNSSHGYISYAVFCLKKKNNSPISPSARPGQRPRLAVGARDRALPGRPATHRGYSGHRVPPHERDRYPSGPHPAPD